MYSLSLSLSQNLRGSHLVSDHLAQGLLEKVIKIRMVAERLLDLRLPKFFSPVLSLADHGGRCSSWHVLGSAHADLRAWQHNFG